jgi:hypothetical protein
MACPSPIGVSASHGLSRACASIREHSVVDRQEPSSEVYGVDSLSRLRKRIDELSKGVKAALAQQGFRDDRIELETYLNLRCVVVAETFRMVDMTWLIASTAPIRRS